MNRLAPVAAAAALTALLAPAAHAAAPDGGFPQSSPLRIAVIHYNPTGSDTKSKLNDEWISIHNPSSTARTMTGWHIHDAQGHHYTFKTFKLGAGNTVRVHTGHGTNGPANKYWDESWYVWNNTGDTATLTGPKGTVVDSCHYSDPNASHSQVKCS